MGQAQNLSDIDTSQLHKSILSWDKLESSFCFLLQGWFVLCKNWNFCPNVGNLLDVDNVFVVPQICIMVKMLGKDNAEE